MIIFYVVQQTQSMYGYKLDKYSNQHMANDFSEDFDFKLKDFNFLPSY